MLKLKNSKYVATWFARPKWYTSYKKKYSFNLSTAYLHFDVLVILFGIRGLIVERLKEIKDSLLEIQRTANQWDNRSQMLLQRNERKSAHVTKDL